jgi:hypothetical protein
VVLCITPLIEPCSLGFPVSSRKIQLSSCCSRRVLTAMRSCLGWVILAKHEQRRVDGDEYERG